MKTTLIIFSCIALLGCANDQAYWDRQRALIAQLPPSQRAAAEMQLLQAQHAEQVARRQIIGDAIQRAGHDFASGVESSIQQPAQPAQTIQQFQNLGMPQGSAGNPIHVAAPPNRYLSRLETKNAVQAPPDWNSGKTYSVHQPNDNLDVCS